MENVYVLGGMRTYLGRRGGQFKNIRPELLAAELCCKLMREYAIQPEAVICGNAVGTGGNITRLMALSAGIAESVPAFTVDMQCASGLMAIDLAASKIMCGQYDIVIAGGFESSSLQPRRIYAERDERYTPEGYMTAQFSPDENTADAMLRGAERSVRKLGIMKSELDFWSLESHRRAVMALKQGILKADIADCCGGTRDECIRPRINQRLLERSRPIFSDGLVTAANACSTNDGAALLVLCSARFLRQSGRKARARIAGMFSGGSEPECSPLTVGRVVDGLLERCKLCYDDIAAFEYNEAFAVIDAIFERQHPNLLERYNRFGGALAYGHPYAASGGVILLHLLRSLEVSDGRYGAAAIAGAGGLGTAMLIERAE